MLAREDREPSGSAAHRFRGPVWSSELGGYKAPLIGDNIEVINAACKRATGGLPAVERPALTGLRRTGEASLYFVRLNPTPLGAMWCHAHGFA